VLVLEDEPAPVRGDGDDVRAQVAGATVAPGHGVSVPLDEVGDGLLELREGSVNSACSAAVSFAHLAQQGIPRFVGDGVAPAGELLLDTRWQNAAAPACNKFTVATMGSVKKYAPNTPAETRKLEAVAKKVWQGAMTKLSTEAPDAACRTAYNKVKAGW
jgi:hypothetical protein